MWKAGREITLQNQQLAKCKYRNKVLILIKVFNIYEYCIAFLILHLLKG